MSQKPESGTCRAEKADESRPGESVRHFEAPGKSRATDGILIRTRCGDGSWIGLFSRGESSYNSFGWLTDETLVVASGGAIYLVEGRKPETWWSLPSPFYTHLHIMTNRALAVAINPWAVHAFDSKQLIWSYEPNSDGIEFLQERDGVISVRALIVGGTRATIDINIDSGVPAMK